MTSFKGPPQPKVTISNLCSAVSRHLHLPILGLLLLSLLLTITNVSTSTLLVSAHTDFFYQSSHLFQPPDPSRPCRHIFRNDVEASALLADFVLEGIPIPTYQPAEQAAGLLYNASIHVRQVAKRPSFSIYPVRKDFPILAGPFSRRTDLGRCWVNVQFGARYIFFIERPNWAGFFQITQIPVRFTVKRWQTVQNIVRRGASPLQMRPLYHAEKLNVMEGNELMLNCRVKGRPTPLISWYVNSTRQLGLWDASTGRGVIHTHRRSSKLHISNIKLTDTGNYSCLAENVNGFIRKTVFIIVSPKPVTTSKPEMSTPAPISVHPCYQYCLHGVCSLIDGRPSCRCYHGYLGRRCETLLAFSCFSPYDGQRCNLVQSSPNPAAFDKVKELESNCTAGGGIFFGRFVLFSTFGALTSLLVLLLLCLFVKKHANRPHQKTQAVNISTQKIDIRNPSDAFNRLRTQSIESVTEPEGIVTLTTVPTMTDETVAQGNNVQARRTCCFSLPRRLVPQSERLGFPFVNQRKSAMKDKGVRQLISQTLNPYVCVPSTELQPPHQHQTWGWLEETDYRTHIHQCHHDHHQQCGGQTHEALHPLTSRRAMDCEVSTLAVTHAGDWIPSEMQAPGVQGLHLRNSWDGLAEGLQFSSVGPVPVPVCGGSSPKRRQEYVLGTAVATSPPAELSLLPLGGTSYAPPVSGLPVGGQKPCELVRMQKIFQCGLPPSSGTSK
ncbi:negative regulator of glucose-controlled proteins [Sparganum proliferum]